EQHRAVGAHGPHVGVVDGVGGEEVRVQASAQVEADHAAGGAVVAAADGVADVAGLAVDGERHRPAGDVGVAPRRVGAVGVDLQVLCPTLRHAVVGGGGAGVEALDLHAVGVAQHRDGEQAAQAEEGERHRGELAPLAVTPASGQHGDNCDSTGSAVKGWSTSVAVSTPRITLTLTTMSPQLGDSPCSSAVMLAVCTVVPPPRTVTLLAEIRPPEAATDSLRTMLAWPLAALVCW